MPLDFNKTYVIIKDSYDLMENLLSHTFGYHERLKRFIKAVPNPRFYSARREILMRSL
jgi:hypothetical protein